MSENLLMMLTVGGVFLGCIVGFMLKYSKSEESGGWTKREIMYIQFPGDLFLRMLKSLILPLIVSSIVSAIGSLDLGLSGKDCYYSCPIFLDKLLLWWKFVLYSYAEGIFTLKITLKFTVIVGSCALAQKITTKRAIKLRGYFLVIFLVNEFHGKNYKQILPVCNSALNYNSTLNLD